MAKKTAPKKKALAKKPAKKAPAKAKTVKKAAPVAKPVAKVAAKVEKKSPPKILKPIAKAPANASPKAAAKAVGKRTEPEEEEEKVVTKQPTVISMLEESSAPEDLGKAEKVSKIKPVKIERGNLADEKAKWAELYKKYGKEKAVTYKMSDTFQTMVPMQHKVLGWGFVLTNENDRLEVLFETGIRMLISNYKV